MPSSEAHGEDRVEDRIKVFDIWSVSQSKGTTCGPVSRNSSYTNHVILHDMQTRGPQLKSHQKKEEGTWQN